MILAQTLSKLQREGNFNLTQLSEYTGVSRKTISRILSHKRSPNVAYSPSYKTLKSIAKSLGTSTDELYKTRMEIRIVS